MRDLLEPLTVVNPFVDRENESVPKLLFEYPSISAVRARFDQMLAGRPANHDISKHEAASAEFEADKKLNSWQPAVNSLQTAVNDAGLDKPKDKEIAVKFLQNLASHAWSLNMEQCIISLELELGTVIFLQNLAPHAWSLNYNIGLNSARFLSTFERTEKQTSMGRPTQGSLYS